MPMPVGGKRRSHGAKSGSDGRFRGKYRGEAHALKMLDVLFRDGSVISYRTTLFVK